jgi:hypothetical protein
LNGFSRSPCCWHRLKIYQFRTKIRVKCYFSPLIQEGLTTEKKKENACPKCKTKKCIYQEPENGDAPGASPRRYSAPIAIMLLYLDRVLGNTEESHAPTPPMGAGLAKGG